MAEAQLPLAGVDVARDVARTAGAAVEKAIRDAGLAPAIVCVRAVADSAGGRVQITYDGPHHG